MRKNKKVLHNRIQISKPFIPRSKIQNTKYLLTHLVYIKNDKLFNIFP